MTSADQLPGSLISDNKTLAGAKALSFLVGSWNLVNETRGTMSSGTITFKSGYYDIGMGSNADFIETING